MSKMLSIYAVRLIKVSLFWARVLACLFAVIIAITDISIRKHFSLLALILFAGVIGFLWFRIHRNKGRRCPRCLQLAEKNPRPFFRFLLKIFAGWLFLRKYHRMPTGTWPRRADSQLCIYDCECLVCGFWYQTKPSQVKSFAHRSYGLVSNLFHNY
jgi:hypothetical protein